MQCTTSAPRRWRIIKKKCYVQHCESLFHSVCMWFSVYGWLPRGKLQCAMEMAPVSSASAGVRPQTACSRLRLLLFSALWTAILCLWEGNIKHKGAETAGKKSKASAIALHSVRCECRYAIGAPVLPRNRRCNRAMCEQNM